MLTKLSKKEVDFELGFMAGDIFEALEEEFEVYIPNPNITKRAIKAIKSMLKSCLDDQGLHLSTED